MRHSVPSLTIFQNHRFELTDCPPACKVAQAARQSIALGGAEFTIYWPTQRIHQECLYTSQTQSLLNSLWPHLSHQSAMSGPISSESRLRPSITKNENMFII